MTIADSYPFRVPRVLKSAPVALSLTWCVLVACTPRVTDPSPRPAIVHVRPIGPGRVDPAVTDTTFTSGDTLALRAMPDIGAIFTGWYGDTFTAAQSLVLVPRGEMTIEARFAAWPLTDSMVLVRARDSVFHMGSSVPDVPEVERPSHRVTLRHDFHIDKLEVTQSAFFALMPQSSVGPALTIIGDSFPIHNVTWYDAVLFCNARSKAAGYDTVYTYSARCGGNSSCPYVLENLQIHYDRFGFRLPTEAEWEYAYRAGTKTGFFWGEDTSVAGDFAWHFGNSENRLHPVGSKRPNPWGLLDMCGNAAEWVNDWLEPYADSSREEPIGPTGMPLEYYETNSERPVRGGSYRTQSAYLRGSARRLGPYEVPAKALMPDIGFRTVLGAFRPGGTGPGGTTPSPDTLGIVRYANKSDLIGFLGTSNARLVFCISTYPDRRLYGIDFTGSDLNPFSLPDSLPVWNPVISPDGKYAAYSSRGEGYRGESRMTVRRLKKGDQLRYITPRGQNAYIPRFWAGASGTDTFLIYADGASINSLPEWLTEKTYRQKISGINLIGPPEVLWAPGSYHGGLSRDGRFLGTSYTAGRVADLQTGDTVLYYFDAPYNGREDRPQLCNLSMSPSLLRTGEVLLLDFGYPKTSTLIGRPYGLHEFIFRCNSKLLSYDQVDGWFEKPQGYRSWNDVEYTNHPDFATAIAENGTETAIFLINLRDSLYLKLMSGKGLKTPWLWIDPVSLPEVPDPYYSFGHYDHPIQSPTQIFLDRKLKIFWKMRDSVECLFWGSSTIDWGIDLKTITSVRSINLAAPGATPFANAVLARQYGLPLTPGLKVLCIGFDPWLFRQNPEYPSYVMCGIRDSKGYELDSANHFWQNGLPGEIRAKIASYGSAQWPDYDSRGQVLRTITGPGWDPIMFQANDFTLDSPLVAQTIVALEELCTAARAEGIHILLIHTPQHPGYGESDYIGGFGPTVATFREMEEWVRNLESTNPYVHYYDANNYGEHDYPSSEAYDCTHLNSIGAQRLSARVDSILKVILTR